MLSTPASFPHISTFLLFYFNTLSNQGTISSFAEPVHLSATKRDGPGYPSKTTTGPFAHRHRILVNFGRHVLRRPRLQRLVERDSNHDRHLPRSYSSACSRRSRLEDLRAKNWSTTDLVLGKITTARCCATWQRHSALNRDKPIVPQYSAPKAENFPRSHQLSLDSPQTPCHRHKISPNAADP